MPPRDDANVVSVIGNSTFTWNGTGVRSIPPAGTTSDVLVQNSVFSGNGIGAQSSTGASTMRLKDTTLFANTTGVAHPGGGIALSLTGNSVIANTINGTFTGTLNPQ